MSAAVAALVLVVCRDEGRELEATLDAVARQSSPPRRTVVLDCGSSAAPTRAALARLGERGVGVEPEDGDLLAAVRRALSAGPEEAIVLLAAGDRLPERFLEQALAPLADPGIAVVATSPGTSFDLAAIAAGGGPTRATVARRRVWELGGLAGLPLGPDLRAAWFAAAEAGLAGVAVDAGPVRQAVGPRGFASPAVAAQALAESRRSTLEPRVEAVLQAAERRLLALRERQRALVAEKEALEREVGGLRREVEALVAAGVPRVDWGDLRRPAPLSPVWGLDRGRPLDRHYVESFLARHRLDVRGRVLEVKDAGYTRTFGDDRVTRIDVLDLEASNPEATLVGDLTAPQTLPPAAFDCIVLTQTLHLVRDPATAVVHLARALRPGGVLLVTVPAASRISDEDRGLDGDFWRFTEASLHALFAAAFSAAGYQVSGFGNVLAVVAFLHGLDPGELAPAELEHRDPYFPLLYGVRAVRPSSPEPTDAAARGAILLYHRIADDGGPGAISRAAFRDQMEHLRQGYRLLELAEVAAAVMEDRLPPRAVAVTFDDAYAELRELGPELAAMGIPITVFAIGELIANGDEPAWERERRLPAAPPRRTLAAGDLRRLADLPGVAIGSHTEHHRFLPREAPAVVRDELRRGRETLEAVLGRPVDALAYPFGAHDATTVTLARELGFRYAVTVEPRAVTPRCDPHRLPRLEVRHPEVESFAAWLEAFFR